MNFVIGKGGQRLGLLVASHLLRMKAVQRTRRRLQVLLRAVHRIFVFYPFGRGLIVLRLCL